MTHYYDALTHDDNEHAEEATPRYAGFWRRLLASLLDSLAFTPLIALEWWAASSRTAALVLLIPISAAGPLYSVAMHARWGQTLGKMAAGIRVVTAAGHKSISWRHALLRDSVGIALNLVGSAAVLITTLRLPASSWGHGWFATATLFVAAQPAWGRWSSTATMVWSWSELLVLLLNKRRRALHDFLAGTVVMRVATPEGGPAAT